MGTKFVPGLEGVVVSETDISVLDTDIEKIIIRGYDLIELSQTKTYLDIVHLLLEGDLATDTELENLQTKLNRFQSIPEELYEVFSLLNKQAHPMDAQRTGISIIANYDNEIDDNSLEKNKERAYSILAQLPNITVNSYRKLNNQAFISPRDDLSYSANFLYMI